MQATIEVGGQGRPAKTFGKFEVWSGREVVGHYDDYLIAKQVYDGIDSSAALWDDDGIPELIHSKRLRTAND